MKKSDDKSALYARLDDLIAEAQRGELVQSAFLTPKERYFAEAYLVSRNARFITFGGYDGAERQKIYILPEYMEDVHGARELAEYGFDSGVACAEIAVSGYRELSHRDYMGAVLGFGVERSVIGDIIVGGRGAFVVCEPVICDFLIQSLSYVGSDKVKVCGVPLEKICVPERRYSDISDTVASPRIDCTVGALCSLSREKARAAVEAGLVEVNYEREMRPDRIILPPCTVTVRGYGKFDVLSVGEQTRKGRYRLSAKKYL